MIDSQGTEKAEPVAIIGMTGRFPGAATVEDFWTKLRAGADLVTRFDRAELERNGVAPELLDTRDYVKAAAVVDGIDLFDAALFGVSPREAEVMDPQQRLFLECAWEALETAGYADERHAGVVGVFAGAHASTYFDNNVRTHPELLQAVRLPATLGNSDGYLCTRASYHLNLTGPSVTVQTACSTSLVAVCLACDSLATGQCDMALAGGVTLWVPHRVGYLYTPGGIGSPDGCCRSFDARAAGSPPGNGLGIVVLKRLNDAIDAGDHIAAVIRGWAINNDGSTRVGFTAPSVAGQARVIGDALAVAGVNPASIGFVEAHGTGTPLGDPIEVAALTRAFRAHTDRREFCALGSVKTNVGHLDVAAGIVGLMKAVLAVRDGVIPPTRHFESPNPAINFPGSPFYVPRETVPWPVDLSPRRAGISSFGLGGTNAHVIIEQPPEPVPHDDARAAGPQVLVLSAKTDSALKQASNNLAVWLRGHRSANLSDVAFTYQSGRRLLPHRRVVLARTNEEACAALSGHDVERVLEGVCAQQGRTIGFMFPGLGDQYSGMGRTLYHERPVFRNAIDRCAAILHRQADINLLAHLHPPHAAERPHVSSTSVVDLRQMLRPRGGSESGTKPLGSVELAHPALFAVDYALAELCLSWGVRPSMLIGYSLGEYVAACVAGVFSLDDALRIVCERATLISKLPPGDMLAVALGEADLLERRLLTRDLCVAATNGPGVTVVAGPGDAIGALGRQLAAHAVACRRLGAGHAFHSGALRSLVDPLRAAVDRTDRRAPRIPFVSNVTGRLITDDQATSPDYWARHLCEPVRFGDGLAELWRNDDPVLLELGPGHTLTSLALQHPAHDLAPHAEAIALMRAEYEHRDDDFVLMGGVARLWLAGVEIDWRAVHGTRRHRVALPAYPFERRRFWLEPALTRRAGAPDLDAALVSRRADIRDWFYVPGWKQAVPAAIAGETLPVDPASRWLVFCDANGVGAALIDCIRSKGAAVVAVVPGHVYARVDPDTYSVAPGNAEDYRQLLQTLAERSLVPTQVLHAWLVDASSHGEPDFDRCQDLGFQSLLALVRAHAQVAPGENLQIVIVSTALHRVHSSDEIEPAKSPVLGLCKVVPQEYPAIACRSVDLDTVEPACAADVIMTELHAGTNHPVVAYRGGLRWVESYEAVSLGPVTSHPPLLRRGGTYLITGGLGPVALRIASFLRSSVDARVALISRTALPHPDGWAEWLSTHPADHAISVRIRGVQALGAPSDRVLVMGVDVADRPAMQAAVRETVTRLGALRGVIHAAGPGDDAWCGLPETSPAVCERQFRPKIRGVYVLDDIVREHRPDFCLLFSSTSAVLGGVGFAAYSGANRFLDAFVSARQSQPGTRWMSVNWDGWRAENTPPRRHGLGASLAHLSMSPAESIEALRRILATRNLARLVVSPGDLSQRIAQWTVPVVEGHGASALVRPHSRSRIKTPYLAPRNDMERTIAAIWEQALGIAPIGVADNFFELGGHSLLGIHVVARIRSALRAELPVWNLFKTPTIGALADAVLQILAERVDPDTLSSALAEIEREDAMAVSLLDPRTA